MVDSSVNLEGRKVLAVDDMPASLEVLVMLLGAEGFDVHVAVGRLHPDQWLLLGMS
jgi:CheY-like chemotaxis protein